MSIQMIRPTVVLHADWGTAPAKRWVATAGQRDALPARSSGFSRRSQLASQSSRRCCWWWSSIGRFDFPIGIPTAWAQKADIPTFLGALPTFGHDDWRAFYEPAEQAAQISIR